MRIWIDSLLLLWKYNCSIHGLVFEYKYVVSNDWSNFCLQGCFRLCISDCLWNYIRKCSWTHVNFSISASSTRNFSVQAMNKRNVYVKSNILLFFLIYNLFFYFMLNSNILLFFLISFYFYIIPFLFKTPMYLYQKLHIDKFYYSQTHVLLFWEFPVSHSL